ncbi:zinc-ribbon domain-containing protein [Shimia sp. W99]
MRLTCPNCGAQYEVPDDVIPLAGRDVQCSNCGDTWFQSHPEFETPQEDEPFALSEHLPEEETEDENADDTPPFDEVEPPEISLGDEDEAPDAEGDGLLDEAEEDWELESDPWEEDAWAEDTTAAEESTQDTETVPAKDDLRGDDDQTGDDTDADDTDADDALEEEPPVPDAATRRGLDPAIADVLREEAEHEARVRAAETLETQTELGLRAPETESDRHALQAKARMRRLRGLPTEEDEPSAPAEPMAQKAESRRELLPDIEEINSTLRGSSEASLSPNADPAVSSEASRKRGFRIGFVIVLLLALLAILAYSKHQEIAAAYPPAAPYLESFVSGANNGRVWLDSQVTNLFLMLNNIASGS